MRQWHGLIGLLLACAYGAGAKAEDFYNGKVVTIVVGAPAGAIYDLTARVFGRHLAEFLPGHPTVVIQNMPGAAGMRAENWLYNVAPRDGTTLGLSLDNILLNPILSPQEVKYKADEFQWIGVGDRPTRVLFVWGASDIRTIDDAKKRDVLIGITAPGTSTQIYPSLANAFLGTRFKQVRGYEGAGALNMAIERGEIEGVGANSWPNLKSTKPDWLTHKKVRPLFQVTMTRDAELPDVPTLLELVKDGKARQIIDLLTRSEIGFFLVAPPGTPTARVTELRGAFKAMLASPAYRAEAATINLGSHSISGEELQRNVMDIARVPAAVTSALKAAATAQH
jgi:tripartite-type tricarboxylate transporter receptor subunit TctC